MSSNVLSVITSKLIVFWIVKVQFYHDNTQSNGKDTTVSTTHGNHIVMLILTWSKILKWSVGCSITHDHIVVNFDIVHASHGEALKYIWKNPTRPWRSKYSKTDLQTKRLPIKRRPPNSQQILRPKIFCENTEFDNVYKFEYLVSLFTADEDENQDIQSLIVMTQNRWKSIRHIFGSPHLHLNIKIRLYSVSVYSLLPFGCGTWKFTDKVMCRINGVTSRMLVSFTSKTIQQESQSSTSSLDLVLRLRKIHLRWMGHILRTGPTHIMYQAVADQDVRKVKCSLLVDSPPTTTDGQQQN